MATTYIPWCKTKNRQIGPETSDRHQAWQTAGEHEVEKEHDATVYRKTTRDRSQTVTKQRLINSDESYKSNWGNDQVELLRKLSKRGSQSEPHGMVENTVRVFDLIEDEQP